MTVSRKILGIILYLSLLGSAVIFVEQTVEEFIKGATSYTEEHKAVSLHDLPTIVVCLDFDDVPGWHGRGFSYNLANLFPMTYGEDVIINVTTFGKEKETVTLLENQGVQTSLGLNILLNELKMAQKWACYKISTKWIGGIIETDIEDFRMQLVFSFPTANESTFLYGYKGTGKVSVLSW